MEYLYIFFLILGNNLNLQFRYGLQQPLNKSWNIYEMIEACNHFLINSWGLMDVSHYWALVCFVLWVNGSNNKLLSKLVSFENEVNTVNNYSGIIGINRHLILLAIIYLLIFLFIIGIIVPLNVAKCND